MIEFLSRRDAQAKIRGFRVEPGELEVSLRRHPGIADAVVAVRADAFGTRRLVAYVVGAGGPAPPDLELQAWLGQLHL